MIELDGSGGEGGGQILRSGLVRRFRGPQSPPNSAVPSFRRAGFQSFSTSSSSMSTRRIPSMRNRGHVGEVSPLS
jgi:hypothetical protein